MTSRAIWLNAFWFCLLAPVALGQSPCSSTQVTNKSICLIPQIYGPGGLDFPTLVGTGHQAHFSGSEFTSLSPLNTAIGSQLTLLPFASPASGFTFSLSGGVPSRSSESFGPILAERAETIGRHKLFVGASYQFFSFNSIGGVPLKHLPTVFKHEDDAPCNGQPDTSTAPCPEGDLGQDGHTGTPNALITAGCPFFPCGDSFEREAIPTDNRIDLKVHQITAVATFGLTDKIDISVAVPILVTHMAVTSTATVIPNSVAPGDPDPNDYPHIFHKSGCPETQPLPPNCMNLSSTFSNRKDASGVGDLVFRVKGTVWKGERFGIAAAADFRAPTGDENNFLGAGTWGVKPFLVVSYRGRIAPHANIGYQWNGDSILAGAFDASTNTAVKGHLPNQFLYTVGADLGVTKHITALVDFVGQRVFDGRLLSVTQFTDQGTVGGVQHTFDDLSQSTGSFNVEDLSLGLKIALVDRLLITTNVLVKLNDGGLRAKAVPLVGVSYSF